MAPPEAVSFLLIVTPVHLTKTRVGSLRRGSLGLVVTCPGRFPEPSAPAADVVADCTGPRGEGAEGPGRQMSPRRLFPSV